MNRSTRRDSRGLPERSRSQSGFTLIELLVVIAIIGLLTAVVMVSLSTARAKGADAAIKANLGQVRNQTELYYDDARNYGADTSDCADAASMFATTTIATILTEVERVSAASTTCMADDGDPVAGTAATSWAVSVPLKTNPTVSWCIDSAGVATTGAAQIDPATDLAGCL